MKGENGVPVTPDWIPEPRAWNPDACCGICETPTHHAFIHLADNIILGAE